VATWSRGANQRDGISNSWIKIKNPHYSQAEGRHELFERTSDSRQLHGPLRTRAGPLPAPFQKSTTLKRKGANGEA
jgi:hypothetical protein